MTVDFGKIFGGALSVLENAWTLEQEKVLKKGGDLQVLNKSFTLISRKIKKVPLEVEIELGDLKFEKNYFDTQTLVRLYFLQSYGFIDQENANVALEKLFQTASLEENVSLYKILAVLPESMVSDFRITEGLRSNIKEIFEAISHNPISAWRLAEASWNQMVLKSLFIGSAIYKIPKIDEKINLNLSLMVVDYIRERFKAKREVSAEIWRLTGDLIDPCFDQIWSAFLGQEGSANFVALALVYKRMGKAISPAMENTLKKYENWDDLGQLVNEETK